MLCHFDHPKIDLTILYKVWWNVHKFEGTIYKLDLLSVKGGFKMTKVE